MTKLIEFPLHVGALVVVLQCCLRLCVVIMFSLRYFTGKIVFKTKGPVMCREDVKPYKCLLRVLYQVLDLYLFYSIQLICYL